MNATTVPAVGNASSSLYPENDESLDLDTRVMLVEQRLIAREQRCRQHVEAVSSKLSHALRPRKLVLPVVGTVLGGAALWWLFRGRGRAQGGRASDRARAMRGQQDNSAHHRGRGRQGGAGDSGARGPMALPWVRWLGLAWPLLPAKLRDGTHPALASTLLSLGLPIIEAVLVKRRQMAPLPTVADFDTAQLAGEWHLLARLPQSDAGRSATEILSKAFDGSAPGHTPAQDEADGNVEPGGLPADPAEPMRMHYTPGRYGSMRLTQRLIGPDGRTRHVDGVLRPAPDDEGAAAEARFQLNTWPAPLRWLPGTWTDHWVLHFAQDASQVLIGSPDRRSLWLLSRTLPADSVVFARSVQVARSMGFAVQGLVLPDLH